jgi:hypothetical protein
MSDRPTSMAHSTASRLSKRHSFRLKHTLANPQLSRSGAAPAVPAVPAAAAAVSTTGSILQQLEGSSSSGSHHAPSGTGGSAAGAGAARQGGGSSVATSTPAAVLAAAAAGGDPLAQYRGLALLQRPTLRECVQPCRETLLAEVDLCHKHARRIGGRLKVRPLQAYNLLTKDVSKRVYVVVRTHLQQVCSTRGSTCIDLLLVLTVRSVNATC